MPNSLYENKVSKLLNLNWEDEEINSKLSSLPEDHKYRDRKRSLIRQSNYIQHYFPEYLGKKSFILDLSCGNGVFLEIMRALTNSVIMGTEKPYSNYIPFLISQKIPHTLHDGLVIPYPFNNNIFNLVCFVGAINFFPVEKWEDILKEIFRIAKNTVFIGVNVDKVYDQGKVILDNFSKRGWKREIDVKEPYYKWSHK